MAHSTPAVLEICRMVAPSIALRFRDTVPGVDTIDDIEKSSNSFIRSDGAVEEGV